jgi:hypothetical protein
VARVNLFSLLCTAVTSIVLFAVARRAGATAVGAVIAAAVFATGGSEPRRLAALVDSPTPLAVPRPQTCRSRLNDRRPPPLAPIPVGLVAQVVAGTGPQPSDTAEADGQRLDGQTKFARLHRSRLDRFPNRLLFAQFAGAYAEMARALLLAGDARGQRAISRRPMPSTRTTPWSPPSSAVSQSSGPRFRRTTAGAL